MTTPVEDLPDVLQKIRTELSGYFLERDDAIEAMLLTLLSRQHAFLLGPPGTAKSALVRALVAHLTGARYFEALLSRQRPEAAILGQYDLPRLRETGDFVRRVDGYLPTADVAFLDEVGKMSATLGHDLLSITNERRLHQVDNGKSWLDVPLSTMFTGSNEVPTAESEDAAALWDRLLVRVIVDYLQEDGNFATLLGLGEYTPTTTVDWPSLRDAVTDVVPSITIPGDVLESVTQLRRILAGDGIAPSDRRWRASMRLIRASAFFGGRMEADAEDVGILRHSLWDRPEQRDQVARATLKLSDPAAEELARMRDFCNEVTAGIKERQGRALEERARYAIGFTPKVKEHLHEVEKRLTAARATGRSTTQLQLTAAKLQFTYEEILIKCMGMPEEKVRRGKA